MPWEPQGPFPGILTTCPGAWPPTLGPTTAPASLSSSVHGRGHWEPYRSCQALELHSRRGRAWVSHARIFENNVGSRVLCWKLKDLGDSPRGGWRAGVLEETRGQSWRRLGGGQWQELAET